MESDMESHTPTGPGAGPQPGNNDPNATRYFPAAQPGAAGAPSAPSAPQPAPQQVPQQAPPPMPPQQPYPTQVPPQHYGAPGVPPQYGAPPQYGQYGGPMPPPQPPGAPPMPGAGPSAAVPGTAHYVAPQPYQSMSGPYPPAPPQAAQVDRHDRDRTTLGLILIGGGVLFLLGTFSSFGGFGDLVLLALGGAFMYGYFSTKGGHRIGFLIPGAILSGIGVGQVLDHLAFNGLFNRFLGGDITALTLGLGFCAIWFFERKHWWSLIPGTILVLAGLSSMAYIGALWPLALIIIGVYLLYGQSRRR
jgi:hypothetical protein